MSKNEIELGTLISKEYFGNLVSQVVEYLLQNGQSAFRKIVFKLKLSEILVKKSLWILLQHNILNCHLSSSGAPVYFINLSSMLNKNRTSRFMHQVLDLFGVEGKEICEELVRNGQMDAETLFKGLELKFQDVNNVESLLRQKFDSLHNTQFIVVQQPAVSIVGSGGQISSFRKVGNDVVPTFDEPVRQTVSSSVKNNTSNTSTTTTKKRKRIIESDDDDDNKKDDGETEDGALSLGKKKKIKLDEEEMKELIYWRFNEDRLNECLRDKTIADAISQKIDPRAANVVKAILRLAEVKTNPGSQKTEGVTFNEIFAEIKDTLGLSYLELDQVLKIILEDAGSFVQKDGESGGGVYRIDFARAFTELCLAHTNSVVQERYGSKYLRIFTVISLKKRLELKQIDELVMLDPKEAKEFIYRLLEDQFIELTEVARTPDYAPQKSFFLYSINLKRVARMLLDRCYKAASNLIHRRIHETQTYKRVIDKQRRLEAILAQIETEEDRMELEEQMSSVEKEQISKFAAISDKLEKAEMQLDETIFVYQMYLRYAK